MTQPEAEDIEIVKTELFMTSGSPILLGRTRGFLPRSRFAAWEESFTNYFGVRSNERMAYKITMRDKRFDQLYSVVLVFSGEWVELGYDVQNGKLVITAPGI